jgi:hypothetical protein
MFVFLCFWFGLQFVVGFILKSEFRLSFFWDGVQGNEKGDEFPYFMNIDEVLDLKLSH